MTSGSPQPEGCDRVLPLKLSLAISKKDFRNYTPPWLKLILSQAL